jgi:uncharacterized protein DUF4013
MNYTASVSDFFKSPKWMMNLLLAGVCVFIPFVGAIVIKGWLITGFWGRDEERPETFPDFDFNNFGKYLERGLWPFLVTLVSSLALGVALSVLVAPIAMISSLLTAGSHGNDNSCVGAVIVLFLVGFYLVAILGMMFVLTPLTLRASMTQDFGQSFNFAWVKKFSAVMWKEILLSSLFLFAASILLTCVGALVLCIGMCFASVPVYFCWMHLHKQLYRLYLSRGGEPVPISPKLHEPLAL